MKRFLRLFLNIILSVIPWALMFVIKTLGVLLGAVLVPIAAACNAYYSQYDEYKAAKGENPIVRHFTWRFMWLWDNDEDGISNDTYWIAPNVFLQICYWSIRRNPVNNLRYVRYLSCRIKPIKVWFDGSFGSSDEIRNPSNEVQYLNSLDAFKKYDTKIPQWFFIRQGIYPALFIHYRMFNRLWRFWIGWKIYPKDTYRSIDEKDYRYRGAGFAIQGPLKRVLTYD